MTDFGHTDEAIARRRGKAEKIAGWLLDHPAASLPAHDADCRYVERALGLPRCSLETWELVAMLMADPSWRA